MKYILFLLAILFSFSNQERKSLKGLYKLEYKNTFTYRLHNGYITFDDSIYVMETPKNFKVNGTVKYYKTLTLLEGNIYPNLLIDFKTEDIEKDTITFQVHDRHSGGNYLDFSVNSGKFIKIN